MNSKFVTICILLSLLLHTSYALRCYACSGTSCLDPYEKIPSDQYICGSDAVACAKIKNKNNGEVERFCASICSSGNLGNGNNVYCCSKDYCNSSNKIHFCLITLVFSILILFI